MAVFRVNLRAINKHGYPHFWLFETGAPDLLALQHQLRENPPVYGEQLITRYTDERGVLEVLERRPKLLCLPDVASVEIPAVRIVEYEDG